MYKWAEDEEMHVVERLSDGHFFAMDEGNDDRKEVDDWVAEGNTIVPYWTKDNALELTKREIEVYGQDELLKPFWYAPLNHNMHLDLDFTLKIVVKNDDKTYTWKTADKEADGETPVYVQLDKHQLKDMYDTFVDHGEHLFNVQEMHKNAVIALHLDPEATADDIRNYDYTTGW